MDIIIDGYNLLHCAGIVVESGGPYSLEKSRQALLNFLIATLPNDQLPKTTVVYDAKNAPPGLPSSYSQSGIKILFADRHEDADILIARLVKQHSAPKSLFVVSSDHGVQRAARRRKSRFCDSDRWFVDVVRESRAPQDNAPDEKPLAPLSPAEVDAWIDKFDVDLDALSATDSASTNAPSGADAGMEELTPPRHELDGFNPFPEGYGEDILRDED